MAELENALWCNVMFIYSESLVISCAIFTITKCKMYKKIYKT